MKIPLIGSKVPRKSAHDKMAEHVRQMDAGELGKKPTKTKAEKPKKQRAPEKERPAPRPRSSSYSLADRLDDLRRTPVPIVVLAILGGLAGFWFGRPELAGEIIFGAVGAIIGGVSGWSIHG